MCLVDNIVMLDEFVENARQAQVPSGLIKQIAADVRAHPYRGHALQPLYDYDPDRLPMGGFYVRSWPYLSRSGRQQGHTLHLYLSRAFPVYFWNFSSALYPLSWGRQEHREFLRTKGQEIHRQLTAEEA